MMERALETLGRADVNVNSLAPFMKEYHQKAGHYLEKATGYARQGTLPGRSFAFRVGMVALALTLGPVVS